MWFEALTGFREDEVDDVGAMFVVDGEHLTSSANGRTMRVGRFETPTLGELRPRVADAELPGRLTLTEVVGDVQQLHLDPDNEGALFQVASQFNTLEMVSPSVTPEAGIDRYERDRTQGPACAVACGAGTIHRNYLAPVGTGIGQTAERQIDCLAGVALALGVVDLGMRNGYALPESAELRRATDALVTMNDAEVDHVRSLLQIGLQHDTEVTLNGAGHAVTQTYCSAVPVAYSGLSADAWEPLARLVLEAAYEATLAAAVVNAEASGNRVVYLTLLGGGVFGNPSDWIIDAIQRAARVFAAADLDVRIVSYGQQNPALHGLVAPNAA
jgi:hypothetical protein